MDDVDVAALAAALGIPLQPAWEAGVLLNLDVCLRMGAAVTAFAVGDEAGMAGVFEP